MFCSNSNKLVGVFLACCFCAVSYAQQPSKSISLDDAVLLARTQSVDAAVALNELKTAYWEYRTFRADLLPEVNFTATAPSYTKSYNAYQADDGTYKFVRSNYMEMYGKISVNQNIWTTGGTLSLQTSLDYLKEYSGDKNKQFMSVPFAVTLNQPIFGVNDMKWKRKIKPEKYAEAKAAFLSATEEVTMTTIQYFFNLLLAKENVSISRQNLANAEKLYEVAKAKREMGKISQNDVLQLQLNVLNAKSSLTDYESIFKSNMFKLRSYLGLDASVDLDPQIPGNVPEITLNYDDVLAKAQENNSFSHNVARRQLEADYAVAQAKGDLRKINLYAQVGYTGTNKSINSSYENLKPNQVVQVGLTIPLLDWGKRRGQVKVAESNREVTESKLKQETMNFNQNIFILVEQFNNQLRQLKISEQADSITRKRYQTNVETFMVGKISTLDLNDSQTAKDEARREHVNKLFYYWYYYYQVRDLALWNFADNKSIDADFERIIDK